MLMMLRFATMFGPFVVSNWLAKVTRKESQVGYLESLDVLHVEGLPKNCSFAVPDKLYLYSDVFILSANMLVGRIFLVVLVIYIQRKWIIAGSCFVCASMCPVLILMKNTFLGNMVAASVFMQAYACADSCLSLASVEMFPTGLRATATGKIQLYSTSLAGVILYFLWMSYSWSLFLMTALMLSASALAHFLSDLKDQPMVE